MSDIVERLRRKDGHTCPKSRACERCDAADEIEQLRAENARILDDWKTEREQLRNELDYLRACERDHVEEIEQLRKERDDLQARLDQIPPDVVDWWVKPIFDEIWEATTDE